MEFWQELLSLSLPFGGILAGVAYVVRRLFDRALDRDLERFENDLEGNRFDYPGLTSIACEGVDN